VLKSKIRKKILKIREIRNKEKADIKFLKIFNLLRSLCNVDKKIIGGYYPINFEVDDLEILKQFEKKKIKIALPIVKNNFKMHFVKCSLNEPFNINRFGIPEPNEGKIVYPDILLIPLVAFDKKLNRLGYGAGFYDRAIMLLKKKKNLITIGLGFDFQEVNLIPVSKYDQKLDFIVTNKKIFK